MSQINYKILKALSKHDLHIRSLAKLLGSNQTTIARKTKELEDNNVIDFRIEGKNKVYHIKDSLEARHHLKIMEHQIFLEALERFPILRQVAEKVEKEEKIGLAIIFGSYAKASPDKRSDIDVYIDAEDSKITKDLSSFLTKLSIKAGKFDKNSTLAKEIIKDHIIIKGVEKYHETLYQEI